MIFDDDVCVCLAEWRIMVDPHFFPTEFHCKLGPFTFWHLLAMHVSQSFAQLRLVRTS